MNQQIDHEVIRAVYRAACHALAEKDRTYEAMTCVGSAVGHIPALLDEIVRLQDLLDTAVDDISKSCNTCGNWFPKQKPTCRVGGCEKLFSNKPENWKWRGFETLMKVR